MKVGEARGLYSTQLREYNTQKYKLAQEKAKLKEKIKNTENGQELYEEQAAYLDLQYNAVADKQNEYQKYMDQLLEQWSTKIDLVSSEQQKDAMEEYYKDISKIMTVARRMMHGDIVPGTDEKKLMEYDSDLYQMAKEAQMMAQVEKRKKYKSLWEDEEKKQYDDPMETADDQEAFADGPEIVDVSETMETATESMESSE
jgi:hypothetical protein